MPVSNVEPEAAEHLARRQSDRAARRLSEVARHVVIPEGIAWSLWDDVAAVCEELGDSFDAWQDGAGQVSLGIREDGSFAATVGGVVFSIPRQVAKTFLVGRIVFALCCLYPDLMAIWTAQRESTAKSAFRSLVGLATRPAASRYVERVLTGDELTIIFKNGSVFRFGARAQNFGRGETRVDVEVFDEAQLLRSDTLTDMVPAANQATIPHGALLFFMGTPPRPKDDGDEFAQRRAEALKDKPPGVVLVRGDMVYVECSADESVGTPDGPGLMDKGQIEKANPSYPNRTPWISILRMRKNLKNDDDWRREALGVWDSDGVKSWQVVGRTSWTGRRTDDAPTSGTVAFAVKFSPDGERVSAAIAIRPAAGPTHVVSLGVTAMPSGAVQAADWLAKRAGTSRILVDGKAGAGDFVEQLVAAGVPRHRVRVATTDEVITAHSGMLRAINEGDITHGAQPGLDAAVRVAGKRRIGTNGGFGWQSVTADGDVTAFDAVTLAHYMANKGKRTTGTGQGRTLGNRATATSGRQGVVM